MSSDKQTSSIADWPEPKKYRRSIGLEMTLYIGGVILALMTITGYIVTDRFVTSATDGVVDRLLAQARSYSGPAGKHMLSVDGPDVLMLNNVCGKLAGDNPDVYWVGIAGPDRAFIAHTDMKQVLAGQKLREIEPEKLKPTSRPGEILEIGTDSIVINIPIREKEIDLGFFAAATSLEPVKRARADSILTVVTITLAMVVLSLPLTMLLLHRKLRPVKLIASALMEADPNDISLSIPVPDRNEFGFLAATLGVMGQRLAAAQHQMVERERMAKELEIAREIQASILPQDLPNGQHFELSCMYRSALQVGGDYYDFIEIDDNWLAFLVADVSGKSLPGMLVMLMTRDIVLEVARRRRNPSEVLSEVNARLAASIHKGMFVTMFYGLLNKRSGQLRYASAGHNPLVVLSPDRSSQLLKTKGYPLGMMPADAFCERIEESTLQLEPGQWLVQFTDGINEAQGRDEEEYGMDRFVASLQENVQLSSSQLIEKSIEGLSAFVGDSPQYDDITLLAIKWLSDSARTATEQTSQPEECHAG